MSRSPSEENLSEVSEPAAPYVLYRSPDDETLPETPNRLLSENERLRSTVWPPPYNSTRHRLRISDARDLSWIPNESVHLVVTSPPYWTLKNYNRNDRQLAEIDDYEEFLDQLDIAWKECARVLVPGGRICCVVGDVCIPRRKNRGRHWVAPLPSDIQVRARGFGLDNLTPILWYKISNGTMEAKGNGSGYYGKPYQPNGVVKNDIEHILFLRKGGSYRKPSQDQKLLSMLSKEEQRSWYQQIWSDVPGASTRQGHPAPFPLEIAYRLIRMFSFAGDTVLDPFLGTGTTSIAAVQAGRNSIGCDIDPEYFKIATRNIAEVVSEPRLFGATRAEVAVDSPATGQYLQVVA